MHSFRWVLLSLYLIHLFTLLTKKNTGLIALQFGPGKFVDISVLSSSPSGYSAACN